MKLLITGANGLLGQALVQECLDKKINFIATSKVENRNSDCPSEYYDKLNVTSPSQVEQVLSLHAPTHVINTAAMTNVDNCEALPDECDLLNVQSVKYLFNWCKEHNAHLQQLSTDFVFDGLKGGYDEKAATNPLSKYGMSKRNAEEIILDSPYKNSSVIRTSVVYGTGNNLSKSNIVLWAIDALKAKKKLTIVADQFRTPTWAVDLAKGCLGVILNDKKGLYNIAGPDEKSMHAFVVEIAEFLDVPKDLVVDIKTETLNQVAKRPARSGLNTQKAISEFNYQPTRFKDSLSSF